MNAHHYRADSNIPDRRNRMLEFVGKYTTAKVMIDNIDEMTTGQIIQMINHPAFTNPVAVMPDTHYGEGSVVGFTMPITDKVIPNLIGVDISCAMLMLFFSTTKELKMSRVKLDVLIRDVVPFGSEVRDRPAYNIERSFPWAEATKLNIQFCRAFNERFKAKMKPTFYGYEWFERKCNEIGMNVKRAVNSIGTIGSGNHFCEFGVSEKNGSICATIHCGSRQFGLNICKYCQNAPTRRKQEENAREFSRCLVTIKSTLKGAAISKAIKKLRADLGMNNKMDKGLDYLEGEDMQGYLTDMIFCQIYAQENRRVIGQEVCRILDAPKTGSLETIHNYINFNDFIIRKGAVSAHKGEIFILPFNMEDGILLCKGKGNPEWNYSAPHGAGRLMSRNKAKKDCSAEVARKRMQDNDIYTSAVPVDEVKEAYKDPKIIEEAISPTATVVDRVIPIMNMKEGDREKEEE